MKPIVSYEDFAKLDLRVGTVKKCERKEGSEKLLRLTVDFGDDGEKNILSGIAQWYQPEEIMGKQYVFVINLEPRKLMGEESQGMILAANSDSIGEKPILIEPQNTAISGTSIL
jgi:methionine--tRNA ligase beta chain